MAQQQPAAKEDEMPIFRTTVSLVKVDIQVLDGTGRNIPNIPEMDFAVFDENQPQQIAHFERESEPLDLLLLLDVSGSMRRSLEEVAATTRAALGQLHHGDRVGLMLFSRRTQIIQPFTDDFHDAQFKILDSIYKESLGAGTLINESVIAAADYVKQQRPKTRRAILIVTDNEGMHYKALNKEVTRSILNADAVLNAIVVRQGPKPAPYKSNGFTNPDLAPPDVYAMAAQTGGEALDGAGKVSEVFKHIVAGIRSRYFVQYAAPPADPGTFRHIRVELSPAARGRYPGAVVRAREGYYVTAPQ